jgi:hypothetical protein
MKKKPRDLGVITRELQTALKRETADIIDIGRLLNEAREYFVEHGEWLPWLEDNFSLSISTAHNYMAAHKFAIKFPTVVNLKLRPSALYELGHDLDWRTGLFDQKAMKAIFKAAETKYISGRQAREIAEKMRRPPEPPPKSGKELMAEIAARHATAEAARQEADVILGSAPPELPPAPATILHDVTLSPFDQAIQTLKNLQTKPFDKFTGTEHSAGDIDAISDFLRCVAHAVRSRK